MKKTLIALLYNQYFVALLICALVLLLVPQTFNKYKINLEEHEFHREGFMMDFKDLDNDNEKEKVIAFKNNVGNAAFEIHDNKKGLIAQWDFLNEFPSRVANMSLFDMNDNGYSEIYVVTKSNDSIFLNIAEPLLNKGIKRDNIFVDKLTEYDGNYITFVSPFMISESKNSQNEVYFSLQTGFSGNPRNIYCYNFKENKITKSPHLTNPTGIAKIVDIDGSDKRYVFCTSNAPGNKIDTIFTKRSDHSSWLTVLDRDLNFCFEPIEFEKPYFSLITRPVHLNNELHIFACINSRDKTEIPSLIAYYTLDGKLIKERELPYGSYKSYVLEDKDKLLLFNKNSGYAHIYSTQFNYIEAYKLKHQKHLLALDFDLDGIIEWVNIGADNKSCTIYRNDFSNPIDFYLPVSDPSTFEIRLIEASTNSAEFFIRRNNEYFIYNYYTNPFYPLRYLFYLGVYLLVLTFVLLIIKGQKIRMAKNLKIENQIAKLQIKTIRNQVDPHFVFNALNTISEMNLEGDKLEADDFICAFSDLMRQTLSSSDKITHTLKQELDYVGKFVHLQQIRFKNSFDYQLRISKEVNKKSIVPKHVLCSYVENAIKHGLSNVDEQGLLEIEADKIGNNLRLTVVNNGGGFDTSKKLKKYSTGNGILIMEKIYALYTKLYKKKIAHKFIEIKDENGDKRGVKVEVLISN